MESSLRGILQSNLRWIFIGGKGGVGKTTISASLAIHLSKRRPSVLIISTDPAHNLSDAFDQKLNSTPTLIQGTTNLYGMQITPQADNLIIPEILTNTADQASKKILKEVIISVPGVDQAISFTSISKLAKQMDFDVVVFDTAPTGHTMRLLNFPQVADKGLAKLIQLKQNFGGFFQQLTSFIGSSQNSDDMFTSAFRKIETLKMSMADSIEQFQDPLKTTFVAVTIPEFLALYQTERLVQELCRFQIQIGHIVLNQVVFPEDECLMCGARQRMQNKYLEKAREMYEDFHLVMMPLLDEEVRGSLALEAFGEHLFTPYN